MGFLSSFKSADVRRVHLSALTGMEFFEAFVDIESVSAVVVRTKK